MPPLPWRMTNQHKNLCAEEHCLDISVFGHMSVEQGDVRLSLSLSINDGCSVTDEDRLCHS